MSNANRSGSPRFWLIPSADSARIEVESGCHVITALSLTDEGHPTFDADGPDDEQLAKVIYTALVNGGTPAGYQGTDDSLTAAQAAADAAWDAHTHCQACGETVPNTDWLSRDSKCGRCFVVQMSEAA